MPATREQVDQAPRDTGGISRLLLTPTVPRAGGAQNPAKVSNVRDLHGAASSVTDL
jgi:hypothetical protein